MAMIYTMFEQWREGRRADRIRKAVQQFAREQQEVLNSLDM